MVKHLSQQRQRHIARQQQTEWWKDLKTIDVRTATEEEIDLRLKNIKDPNFKRMLEKLRDLHRKGQ